MSLAHTIWSLDEKAPLPTSQLVSEKELENLLAEHIEILNPDWLLIGRQVITDNKKRIDLLCMDYDGSLIVVELKKDLTPREVTAQTLEYASYLSKWTTDKIAECYLQNTDKSISLDDAYQSKYGSELDKESVNHHVKMVIVAAKMDSSTESIIRYLREEYSVDINILFFHVFASGAQRFISRVWFEKDIEEQRPTPKTSDAWSQEYYVSFGSGERCWCDAQKYGFIWLIVKSSWTLE